MRIEGSKVHRVGYRLFLATRAIDLDLPGFSAQNRVEDGRQVMLAFFEGDEGQVAEFKRFIEADKPEEADISSISFKEYEGPVGDTMLFYQKMSAQHLGKGIDAILRMEKKQDTTISILKEVKEDTSSIRDLQVQMLEKQDRMLEKQDRMLEKQDSTISILKEVKEDTASIRSDISELKKDTMDSILEKYLELSREIAEIKATLSEIKAKA